MESMSTNRRCLVWLCICPAGKSTSRWLRLAHIVCATIAMTGLVCGFTSGSAFVWKFISTDVGQSMYAFTFISGEVAAIYMALAAMTLLRHQIDTVFKNLSTIYKARE